MSDTTKHTPGPWHWDSDPVKGDPLGRVRYQVVALGKTITQVYHSSYEGGLTNAEADARLIAAAPDLLEALKLTAGICAGEISTKSGLIEALELARAAISKATGDQQQ